MEEIEDLSKMKVADLKKHLKSRGLSVTGNKTELVDRLQEALRSDENPTLDSSGGGIDDDEFDEEEILGGEDVDIKITQEEEAAALAGNIRVKDNSLRSETQPEKKKITLKRSQPCLSFPVETNGASETATESAMPEPKESSINDKENSLTEASVAPARKVIKLTGLDSAENAIEARAKKFGNVTNNTTDENKKNNRAQRFGTLQSNDTSQNRKAPKLSMETGGTDMEKLKKRAERFGEVTSKSLSKLESLERMKKRQDRFSSASSNSVKKEEDMIDVNSEAEKLEISSENNKKTPITAPTTDDSAKAKRAQRFAI